MRNKMLVAAWTVLALLALTLAACSAGVGAAASTPVPSPVPPTATSAPATDTAIPATATAAPTAAPTSAPTLAASAAAALATAATADAQQTFSDPFAYCAAVGQIDKPDARYTGPAMSDALFKDYLKAAGLDANANYPDGFKQATVWRCMGGQVYACNFGANIPCDSKANTDKTPTQGMKDYCQQSPDSDFIPAAVTGHNGIYNWQCVKGQPQIHSQAFTVDAAGYQASFWTLLPPVN